MEIKTHLLTNFEYLIENNPDGVVIHDDGIIKYANKRILALFGVSSKEEIIGRNIFDFLHPSYCEIAKKRILEAFKTMEPAPVVEYEAMKLDGSPITVEILSIPFLLEGSPAMQVLVKDISEKNRIYKAMKSSEEKFRALFETAPDPIILTNAETNIVSLNKATEDLFGYSYEELIGKSWMVLVPRRHRNERAQKLDEIREKLKKCQEIKEDLFGLNKNGKEIPVEIKIGHWKIEDDLYFTTIIRDISERKLFEEQLKHLATTDHLTGILNRRTGLMLIEQALKTAKRSENKMTLCYLDLDNFKNVNDHYGHVEGDKVLREISNIIKDNLRESDIFCRLGGDEFIIAWTDLDIIQVQKQWKRISNKFDKWNKQYYNSTLGISVGCICPDLSKKIDIDRLIDLADKKMYEAKGPQ
jgi:diguanylate cyclase (GGDEF)-like protein/PAS domain S-box-containing protein